MPIQRLAALAHQSGALLLVDGAQAPGSLAVTLHDTDCDIYTVSAHKWMLAPPGSGLLYINSGAQDLVRASFLDADTPPDPRAPGSCRMAVLCRFLVLSVSLTWEALVHVLQGNIPYGPGRYVNGSGRSMQIPTYFPRQHQVRILQSFRTFNSI